jgi:hypothetical protein
MTLSPRQYPLLKLFCKRGENVFMKIDEAATLDQRPFRSLLMRGWIKWEPNYGFTVTGDGRDAMHAFNHTSIERANAGAPLCAYFYSSYGYESPAAKREPVPITRGRRRRAA